MASQWYCQVLGEQMGPLSWSDLVDLVRLGTVGESDLVRREGQTAWEPAEKVIGLFRAARQGDGVSGTVNSSQSSGSSATNTNKKSKRPGGARSAAAAAEAIARTITPVEDADDSQPAESRRWRRTSIAVGTVAVIAVTAIWWSSRNARFPQHKMTAASAGIASPSHLLKALPPAAPSMPDLAPETATLLPGLEEISNAFSPVLSADLKTIVFAHMANLETGFDLYQARRSSVSEPFGPPTLIVGCQSTECDAYPTLSPNLLELIFVRSDEKPQLMRSFRASVDAEFSAAEPCFASTAIDSDERVAIPQFINAGVFCFARQRIDPPSRLLWLASRNPQGQFEPVQLVACHDPWPLWFISANGMRAYSGIETGVVVVARESANHPFGQNEVWADVAKTGPIDGPLWMAPQEDVIVYCSAGPGKRLGESRQLWAWQKGTTSGSATAGRK